MLLVFILIGCIIGIHALPCLKKEYPDGIVCVCTEEYCDTLENVDLIEKDDIVLVSTSMAGLRFEVTHSKHGRRNSFIANSTKYGINIMSKGDALHPDESTDNLSNLLCMNIDVTVNRSITYQTNVGFGGAFTGAVSHVMETIPKKLQNHVYRSYFSKTEGIGYTMIRMPIGGSDFDFVPWAHQESPVHDASLSNFLSLDKRDFKRAIWVGEHLGPLLRNSSFKDVKLLGGDDQRFVMPYWFEQMNASHKDALRYLDGFAVHWYWNDVTPVVLLDDTHRLFPDKFILNTESCIGVFPMTFHGPLLGSWERAEQYAQSYIEDFTHWVVGWVDWNIVLDEAGGPNYVNGTVDAPIIVNTTAKNEFYKQPMFYAIGHFSRFIVENSTRIKVHSSNDCVLTVGYQRPDKSIVIVLFNKDSQKTNIKLRDGNTKIRLTVPPRSIHTLVYY
ncbi:putative glucosylceramidase 3 isoform X5 [Bradysia coprophila]|uniref:putative glucosylceramidase 3 isoform X5 n=1 Tax=Bradysia coprophila TaxID=38358 RepID=UPI00187DCD11|nr:putative glucosylceramidase 3 isoform X5 [Bradysia coprophila]